MTKEKISISIDSEILDSVEKERGLVNRSTFINDILRKWKDGLTND